MAETAGGNLPEFTVSELSGAVKRTLEGAFERVRVRGEISQVRRYPSGHVYLTLKDEDACLNGVIWRGVAQRLDVQPVDGAEVICIGRVSANTGRSSYQLIVESIELAGEGALLKMIEERRKRLAAEGLFDESRKRKLPYLPDVIGVVTSPMGAVIRDILHRLAERFPRRVIVWPVAVQGPGAAAQIAAAVRGFNALALDGPVPRPDVIIVARGGGSLEDLMAFNEEVVVRAVAESAIPTISGVGHETDTTLVDFAADLRAPTPTGAAEKVVPVRAELMVRLARDRASLVAGADRALGERRTRLADLGRALGDPRRLAEDLAQRLDAAGERLALGFGNGVARRRSTLAECFARLPHPRQQLALARQRLAGADGRIAGARGATARLIARDREALATLAQRAATCAHARIERPRDRIAALGQLLDSLSYRHVLARGYALALAADGTPLATAEAARAEGAFALRFADGELAVRSDESAPAPKPPRRAKPAPQGSLL